MKNFAKSVISVSAFAIAAGAASNTSASDEQLGFYLGGSLGITYMKQDGKIALPSEDDLQDFEIDDDDTGYKLFAGYQMLPWLAIEGGYVDFGEVEDQDRVNGIRGSVAADGWDLFVLGNLPIGIFDIFAKAGVVAWNTDGKIRYEDEFNAKGDESGEDWAYGVGAAVELGSFAFRAEYEIFEVDELDELEMFSIGVTYQF